MALGRRRLAEPRPIITTEEFAEPPGHPFHRNLNEVLAEAGFERWIYPASNSTSAARSLDSSGGLTPAARQPASPGWHGAASSP